MTTPMQVQEAPQAGTTGIEIEEIFVRQCLFEDHLFEAMYSKQPAKSDRSESVEQIEGVDVSAEIGVLFSSDSNVAIVHLLIEAKPKAQPSWSAKIAVVGRYSVGTNPIVSLQQYAWSNGIANLVPYVRERLASLTAASQFQPYVLNPVNVPTLLALAGLVGESSASSTSGIVAQTK